MSREDILNPFLKLLNNRIQKKYDEDSANFQLERQSKIATAQTNLAITLNFIEGFPVAEKYTTLKGTLREERDALNRLGPGTQIEAMKTAVSSIQKLFSQLSADAQVNISIPKQTSKGLSTNAIKEIVEERRITPRIGG